MPIIDQGVEFRQGPAPSLQVHLLGRLSVGHFLRLQRRLVREAAQEAGATIRLLVCEHTAEVTVGRSGRPSQIRYGAEPIRTGRVPVRWVKRGGGCWVQVPGQLMACPIVPLAACGFSVGEYLERFEAGLLCALDALDVTHHLRSQCGVVTGRSGNLAMLGIAVSRGVAHHGALVSVAPAQGFFRLLLPDPITGRTMGSLEAERGRTVRMTTVRSELIAQLARMFDCDRWHLHTGHPLLRRMRPTGHRDESLEGKDEHA